MILQGVLKKIFRLRENVADPRRKGADEGFDPEEKPFLDHLEDLRVMFFKMLITMVISVTACFIFKQQLMQAIQLPMRWADVGNPDAINAIFGVGQKPIDDRFKSDDLVVTRGGLVGKVVDQDAKLGLTVLELAEGLQVRAKTDTILGAIDQAGDDLGPDSLQKLSNQQLLIMETFRPHEGLVIVLKLAFYAGIIVAFPFLLWWLMEFVLPGLRQAEKRAVIPALLIGFLLFLTGAFFAFRVGLPFALRFLEEWTRDHGMQSGWRIGYYMQFITQVTLVFGLAFQLPVAVLVMVKLELLTYRTMRDSRSYAIVAMLVFAAFITPPDPMTLGLLGGPLIILYEICIWIAWFMERAQRKREREEEKRRAAERARLAELSAARQGEEGGESPGAEPAGGPEDSPGGPSGEAETPEGPGGETPEAEQREEVYPHETHEPYHHDHDPYHDDSHDPHHWDHENGHGAIQPAMIDINHASLEELQKLPGVGPKLAERIIQARPFYSEEELEYHAHLPQSVIRLIVDRIYFH